MYKKNKILSIDVARWGEKGLGLVVDESGTLLLPNVIPGETVAAKVVKVGKNKTYAKLLHVIEPSSSRVLPYCDVAETCGGCQLQHVSYNQQLEYKKQRVVQACLDEGIDLPDSVLHGMVEPWAYRKKGQFAVTKTAEGDIQIGLTAARSQRVVDMKKCWIQADPVNKAVQLIREFLNEYNSPVFSANLEHIVEAVPGLSGTFFTLIWI